jgi:hypothetical protein
MRWPNWSRRLAAAVDGADRFLDLGGRVGQQRRFGRDAAGRHVVLERAQAAQVVEPAAHEGPHQQQAGDEHDECHAGRFQHEAPQLGGQLVRVELQAHDAIVLAAHGRDAVDVVQLGGDECRQPRGRQAARDARRIDADRSAGHVDEFGAAERRLDQHPAQRALDRVVVSDHGAVLDRLRGHLDEGHRGVLRLFDVLQELVAVEQPQPRAHRQQQREGGHGEHAADEGARQQARQQRRRRRQVEKAGESAERHHRGGGQRTASGAAAWNAR